MARRSSIAIATAATAFIGLPVLAQTTTSPSATTPPSPGMSAPVRTTSPTSPSMASSSSTTSSATYMTADHQVRMGKLVGASVYNDQNQSIGSVDDVLLSSTDNKAGTVVISVGGFLGMGSKLVSVPFDQLKIQDNKVILPGATKASLEGMPEYHYSNA